MHLSFTALMVEGDSQQFILDLHHCTMGKSVETAAKNRSIQLSHQESISSDPAISHGTGFSKFVKSSFFVIVQVTVNRMLFRR